MTKEEEKYTTLDTEQCKWWVNCLFNMAKEKACNSHNFDDGEEIQSAQDKIIKALEIVEEFEKAQIITGGRLNGRTYAYKCGLEDGKRKALEQSNDDCVSRKAILDAITEIDDNINMDIYTNEVREIIKALSSVTSTFPKNATNGDMIKAMFPNLQVEDNGGSIYVHYPDGGWIVFNRDWWNAPYKRGN